MTPLVRLVLSVLISTLMGFLTAQHAGYRSAPEQMPSKKELRRALVSERTVSPPEIAGAVRHAGADEGWWQVVTAKLVLGEYSASTNDKGLQAPNRAHNLRTYFRAWGVEVVPREGDDMAWHFAWVTAGFGRLGAVRAVGTTPAKPDGSRITYRRPEFDEWYTNSCHGLEQGFTVYAPPTGKGPLCLTGQLNCSLHAELQAKERAVAFVNQDGEEVLRYSELHVWDAGGHEVPSYLSLDGADLAILVDDHSATYPLTVDPLMTSPAWVAESNQAGAEFGNCVSTAGDVNGDGYSDVIVASHTYDNGESNEGRAFVYYGSAAGLATTPAWTAESNQAGARFGVSLATAGDVNGDGFSDVIIGAYLYDNGQNEEGAAFVYHGSAAGLATFPAWIGESDQADARFGNSVSTAGDVNGDGFSDIIVGAFQFDNDTFNEGRAFVYQGSVSGLSASPAWVAESDQASGFFGSPVATAGDVNSDGFSDVIIGALGYDNGENNEGRVYVYHGSGGGLATTPAWTAESNQANAGFGGTEAGDVNGDGFSDVIIGAPGYDNGQTDEGRAYIYHGSAVGLDTEPVWTQESNQAGARMGTAAMAGDVNGDGFADVILAANLYDNGQTDEGRVFIFLGSAVGLDTIPTWSDESNQANAFFGNSVAGGDVNADGFSDVIIGAPGYDNGETDEGRAFAYHGSATTGFEAAEVVPAPLLLEPPRPNPFGPSTELGYALPQRGRARLAIYDVMGRNQVVLVDAVQAAGAHVATWDGRAAAGARLPSGIYFLRLVSNGRVETQRLVLAP